MVYNLIILIIAFSFTNLFAYTVELPDPVIVPGKGIIGQEIILQNPSKTDYKAIQIIPKSRMTNDNLEEILEDTEDILVFPNQVVLEPNSQQVCNIQWVNQDPVDKERAYRVIVSELQLDDGADQLINVGTLLEYSKPIYVRPLTPSVYFKVDNFDLKEIEGVDYLSFNIENAGTINSRIRDIELKLPGIGGKIFILMKDCLPFKKQLRLFPEKVVQVHTELPRQIPKDLIEKLEVIGFNTLEEDDEETNN